MKKNPIITGTVILTATGIITRIIGFFYRIFLSQNIGEEGMGIYQLLAPVMALSFSLTSAGIQTSVSKHVAAYEAKGRHGSSISVLICALLVSVCLSLGLGFVLFEYSLPISTSLLLEARCAPLVRIYALSLPFASLHSCINGYYYGLKKTGVPSVTQLIEQIVRVISVYIIFFYCREHSIIPNISTAVAGLVLGEIVAALISILALGGFFGKNLGYQAQKRSFNPPTYDIFYQLKPLMLLAIPLSVNRIVLNFLQSIEAVYLPRQLCLFGLSNSQALSIYGVLTGMALPLILFPQAITGSIGVLLLPYVSEADAKGSAKRISRAIFTTTGFCLFLGFCSTALFYFFGSYLGRVLFHSDEAGLFIRSLSFMCPFLYLGTLLTSVLNGLNKAGHAFFINVLALCIRLLCIFFLVPSFGIKGYLWGLPASQIAHCIFNFLALKKYIYYNKRC
ncbi:MAG: polysaccharide biosynthesis protein [Lachnospiraceae bacterium]|nr:polysaccharide biosynthesis protein [Lachnospiraceae bacterium]